VKTFTPTLPSPVKGEGCKLSPYMLKGLAFKGRYHRPVFISIDPNYSARLNTTRPRATEATAKMDR